MKPRPFATAAALSIAALSVAAGCPAELQASPTDAVVGVKHLSVATTVRPEPLDVMVWYPARAGGKPVTIGENGVFRGAPGQRNAPVADGPFPVVVVSFGGLRAAPNQAAWLDRRLAERGFVVADVASPHLLGDGDVGRAPAEIWKRPADLSTALTAVEQAPFLAGRLDTTRVGALGFFLGGASTLSLAGARLDAARVARSCDRGGTGMDCAWFARAGVDLRNVDAVKLSASRRDRRVKLSIAVDPEFSTSFSEESLSALGTRAEIVGLGAPGRLPPGLNPSRFDGAYAAVGYHTLPEGSEFSAFNLCKPHGAARLAHTKEGAALCNSDSDVGRDRVHADLGALIVGLLRAHLSPR